MRMRNGKIARLPAAVREEINERLERCERGPQLLAWLNALPAVQKFVRSQCGGQPISLHNLSQWRMGGFQDWLTKRDFFDDVEAAKDLAAEKGKKEDVLPLIDQTATVLAARFAGLLMHWDGKCGKVFQAKARVLSGMCRGIVQLQREAHKTIEDWQALEKLQIRESLKKLKKT